MDAGRYVEALEEERRKILVFRRELPLSLELITQAIDSCRKQLSGTTSECLNRGQSECSEHYSGEALVMEEFIPIKRSDLVDGDEESDEENKMNDHKEEAQSDWLRSAQLWNQSGSPEDNPTEKSVVSTRGAFQPFHRDKTELTKSDHRSQTPAATANSLAETASGGGQTRRKQRLSWSPELHRQFLNALQQLGGSHAATPKQIRELMKVDGLTNDEVKSHLQKYRLHRRTSSAIENSCRPQPQIVEVGGVWVPPPSDRPVSGSEGSGYQKELKGENRKWK